MNEKKEDATYWFYESEMVRVHKHLYRQTIVIVAMAILFFISNALWLYVWMQYDYSSESIQQDGRGINIVGDGNGVENGADGKTPFPYEEEREIEGNEET